MDTTLEDEGGAPPLSHHSPGPRQHEAAALHLATWNLGGLRPDKVLDLLLAFRGHQPLAALQVVFLQEITTSVGGPYFDASDTWTLVHGKMPDEWRGCGIAFRTVLGTHESSRICTAATSFVLRQPDNKALGLLSGHVSHKFTIEQTATTLQEWGRTPALKNPRLCVGLDANETFLQPGGILGHSTLSCTGRGEQILQWFLEQDIYLPVQDMHLPSHFPYNPSLAARRIDYVAARRVRISDVSVGRARDRASSDHEPILATVHHPVPDTPKVGVIWCARQLRPQCQHLLDSLQSNWGGDPHRAIADVSISITEPAQGSLKFSESRELKTMRREARELPAGSLCREAWKAVSRRLQAERRKWKAILADKAGSHDWNALRSLKAKASKTNWAAALLDDPEWADKLRKHMSAIFHKQPPDATRKAMQGLRVDAARLCKSCPWRPFSEQEMRLTMAKWKNHKATGPDGIAMEALKLLFDHEVWKPRLAELLNDCLYRGELTPCIATGASVLLPKKAKPASWTDTRPITLSSAILKWLAQLLLLRGQPLLQDVCQHQWASKGKQGVELILSLRKLARVAHEWKTPFYVVKIDIAKAFDSVAQEKLADLVWRKIGLRGGMPWEARLWFSLLEARELHFWVQKHKVVVGQSNGVRQGSPDSPVLFAAQIGEILDDVLNTVNGGSPRHVGRHRALSPPPHSGAAFMDDTYVWGESPEYVQQILRVLEAKLLAVGLKINAQKTQVISNTPDDPFRFCIGGVAVVPDGPAAIMTILGAPINLTGEVAPIVAEMQARSRRAFQVHRQVLCSRAPLAERLRLHQTLVREAALWGSPAWPIQTSLLQAANSAQLLQIRTIVGGVRTPTERWHDWHIRTMRRARALMHKHKVVRWSTHALQMQWNLWGHIGRAVFQPTFHIMRWRDLTWWRDQQNLPPGPSPRGVRHLGHHNPHRDPERRIGAVAGHQWWIAASDRPAWQKLASAFLEQNDPPWASGNQLVLPGAP